MFKNQKQDVSKLVRSIQEDATGMAQKIDNLSEIDPVSAKDTFGQVLQYFAERLPHINREFTIGELIKLGYIPD